MSESYWWCPNCREEVDGHHVTYQEQHEACGHLVESITPEKQERIAELEAALAWEKEIKYEPCSKPSHKTLEAELAKARLELAQEAEADIGIQEMFAKVEEDNTRLEAELARVKYSAQQMFHEVEQTLGKALRYPWFRDDPANFPTATEADGVCVGEHVPESIALEAANRIRELETDVAALAAVT